MFRDPGRDLGPSAGIAAAAAGLAGVVDISVGRFTTETRRHGGQLDLGTLYEKVRLTESSINTLFNATLLQGGRRRPSPPPCLRVSVVKFDFVIQPGPLPASRKLFRTKSRSSRAGSRSGLRWRNWRTRKVAKPSVQARSARSVLSRAVVVRGSTAAGSRTSMPGGAGWPALGVGHAGRLADQVDDADWRGRTSTASPAGGAEAEVHLLEVHEVPLVHQPDLLEHLAPDDHARPGHPIDLDRLGPLRHRRGDDPASATVATRARAAGRPSSSLRTEWNRNADRCGVPSGSSSRLPAMPTRGGRP